MFWTTTNYQRNSLNVVVFITGYQSSSLASFSVDKLITDHCAPLFALFTIRCSRLFSIRFFFFFYSRLFAIRYSWLLAFRVCQAPYSKLLAKPYSQLLAIWTFETIRTQTIRAIRTICCFLFGFSRPLIRDYSLFVIHNY